MPISPLQGSRLTRSRHSVRFGALALLVAAASASVISAADASERSNIRSCTAAIKPVLHAAGLSVRSVVGQVEDDRWSAPFSADRPVEVSTLLAFDMKASAGANGARAVRIRCGLTDARVLAVTYRRVFDNSKVTTEPISGFGEPSTLPAEPPSTTKSELSMDVTVSGTVTILQRIAILPSSTVVVDLVDTAKGTPGMVVATTKLSTEASGKQPPYPFTLNYNPTTLGVDAKLTLIATITVDGKPTYRNTRLYPVKLGDREVVNIIADAIPTAPTNTLPVLPTTKFKVSVLYLDRSILPVGSVVKVEMLDTAKQDTAAVTLASDSLTVTAAKNGPPFAFELTVDTATSLDPKVQLSLSATIEVEGKMTYRNTNRVSVNPSSGTAVEVVVQRVP